MDKKYNDITLALAGVAQAAALVNQIGEKGSPEPNAFKVTIDSIFATDPETTADVFGGEQQLGLGLGLRTLISQLKGQPKPAADITRYMIGMITLERQLAKRPDITDIIGNRIEFAKSQLNHYPSIHENVIGNLAGIYTDTISTFRFRIQVVGNPLYLQPKTNQDQVRAILLGGIRAAVLWRQLGGSRLQVVFGRRKIVQSANSLYREYCAPRAIV